MTINELLDKTVWQMTGEELLFLAQHGKTHDEGEVTVKSSAKEQKHFVYGLAGLARLFGCSLPTANRIKQSGKIDRAITQIGRKILLSAKLQNDTFSLSATPINRRCGFLFRKVSPPFRQSFIGCPLKRENGRHEMWPNVYFKPLRDLEYGKVY